MYRRKINYNQFDFNIQRPLRILIYEANKKYNNRTWYIQVTYFEDSDFEIQLCSSWGNKKDMFVYKKSSDEYYHNNYLLFLNKKNVCDNCGCETGDR